MSRTCLYIYARSEQYDIIWGLSYFLSNDKMLQFYVFLIFFMFSSEKLKKMPQVWGFNSIL